MSSYRRLRRSGASYFFTVNLADRSACLLTDHVGLLRGAYVATIRDRPLHCDAMVVLPDHLHAVWTLPDGDADCSTRWAAFKTRFTRGLRRAGFSPPSGRPMVNTGRYAGLKPALREQRRETAVWQRRFWEHMIQDEADYRAHVEYCWGNPVKHGLVERAVDWLFSSIHRDIRAGRIVPEWAGGEIEGAFGEQRPAP